MVKLNPNKKSNRRALVLVALLVLVLITALVSIVVILIKGEETKSDMAENNTQAVQTDIKVEEAVKPEVEQKVEEKIESEIKSNSVQLDKNKKNIFLPATVKTYDANGNITQSTVFKWDYYNSPTDIQFLSIDSNSNGISTESTNTRKDNKIQISQKVFMDDELREDLSGSISMEYFDNTSIVLKHETIRLDGKKVTNNMKVIKNQEDGNVRILELFDNSTNTLKKIQINPNGVVIEKIYINNELRILSETKNYYYDGVLITTLSNMEYYMDNKPVSASSYKVKSEEKVDEHTVIITLVRESEINGNKKIDYKTEYTLKNMYL